MKNKHRTSILIVSIIICLIVIYLHLLSHEKTQEIYLKQTEKSIINLKKDFLKDTVNNIIDEIDELRETKKNSYKRHIESRLRYFQGELHLTEEEFIKAFIHRFNDDLNPRMWTVVLWDNGRDEILYKSSELNFETGENKETTLKPLLSSYALIEKDNIKGIFGVSESYIEEVVKKEIGDVLRNRKFSNGSYIWVNEIVDYEGGENYAIRRIHPNLRNTEGNYLSTDMEDVKGNLPYLEELDGINRNGEIFFTYYFKKLNSPDISEKITYAKLYQDYDWIIAMGVHLDDINLYTEKTNNEIKNLSSEIIIGLLRYILIILLIGFIILYLIEQNHLSTSTKSLEEAINLDTLTNSSSRRCGKRSLNELFEKYKLTGEKPAIMLIDIDDFKDINDKYGHQVGDTVLMEIVKIIHDNIRSSDLLIRWGGDEFVGIFPGLREEHIRDFGKKLLEGVSSLQIPVGNNTMSIAISIGFSYFKDTDRDFNDVLKRADDAMYKSKKQGKNRVNIIL